MIKVNINGETHEVKKEDVELGDGFHLITPDKIPEGYYTESALQTKIQSRLKNVKENTTAELLEDEGFNKRILGRYNISLNEEGVPIGLKPDVDVQTIKENAFQSAKEEYEPKLQSLESKLKTMDQKGKTASIIQGASSIGIDDQYLKPLVEGGSPYLIKEMADSFAYNEDINDYALVDPDGSFHVSGNGVVSASQYFESNKDKFKSMLKDQRQKGGRLNMGGNAPSGKAPDKWTTKEKLAYINEHGQDGYRDMLKAHKENN